MSESVVRPVVTQEGKRVLWMEVLLADGRKACLSIPDVVAVEEAQDKKTTMVMVGLVTYVVGMSYDDFKKGVEDMLCS